jgi:riboflavin kinase/FMN adenylyltransferase
VLSALARKYGFGFTEVAPVSKGGEAYSSTRIREHLREGRPAEAAKLLGRCWEIEGRVVPGDSRGRELGIPTANLQFDEYLQPAHGIYAVRAGIDKGAETQWHDAVASYGRRPAVPGDDEVFEAHLLDFSGDLYGKHLRVALVDYLRPERNFDSLDALSAQMRADCDDARKVIAARRGEFRVAERPALEPAPAARNGTRP